MRTAILVFPMLAASVCLADEIRLSGTVYDDVGNPVFGAKVALSRAGDKAYTDPRGDWRLEGSTVQVRSPGAAVDTLVVAWKDTTRIRLPIATYLQTGSVQVLPNVHLGDAPSNGAPATSAGEMPAPATASEKRESEPTFEIDGPYGPTRVKATEAEKTIAVYRSTAARQRSVGKGFLIGGLVAAGIGGIVMLSTDVEESPALFITGGSVALLGVTFALCTPITFGMADDFDRKANDLQRQLDERKRFGAVLRILPVLDRHANPGLAMRVEF